MKKSNLTMVVLVCLLMACTSQENKSETANLEEPDLQETSEEEQEVDAVCIWDNIAVREEPSSESKWLTSISLGETLKSLGTVALDTLDKNRKYVKVRLADGTEGWAIEDFIISDAKVAVFQEDNAIYKRPDLLTKTDNKFSQMDIVAVKSTEGEWVEVVGKRSEGKWIESGWVKQGKLFQNDIDVAVAKFASTALSEKNVEDQVAALQEIIENEDFNSSSFISTLKAKVDELRPSAVSEEEMPGSGEEMVVADTTVVPDEDVL